MIGVGRRKGGRFALDTDDAGITLIEVLVSTGLMSVVMALFTAGILQVYRSTTLSEAMSGAQAQLNTAFLRLDREVRYAAEITAPGPGPAPAREPRVEFLTTHTGVPVCTQLRLLPNADGGLLQRRTWQHVPTRAAGSPLVALTRFTNLASEVSAAQPFERLVGSAAGADFHRLRVRLSAASAPNGSPRHTDVTFTALNSRIPQLKLDACLEGRNIA